MNDTLVVDYRRKIVAYPIVILVLRLCRILCDKAV